jgi:predicted ATP-grasp superfamily ATP-dependent carboligase
VLFRSGIETMSLIVHLPQYTQLEEDYTGAARLMDIVSSMYGIPVDNDYYEKAQHQAEEVNHVLDKNPQLKALVSELEAQYRKSPLSSSQNQQPPLSPEIENFLSDMEKRFREGPRQGE